MQGNCFLTVDKEGTNFGFGGGGHDMTEDVARCVDGPVVARRRSGRLRWIGWILGEEKVATNAAAGSGLGEVVGAITVIVQDHVAGMVANDSIRMRCCIIKEVNNGVESVLGGLGLRGSDGSDGN